MKTKLLLVLAITVISSFLAVSLIREAPVQSHNNNSPGQLASAFQTNDPYYTKQWGLIKIQSLPIYSQENNNTVIVAVLDSGIDIDHEDLVGKVIKSVNFSQSNTVTDVNGHGTHIAGIIAANSDNRIGIAGAAPNARLLNVKVAEDNGTVWAANVASGIVWATDNGAQIINMSLVIPQYNELLRQAVEYAWSHGVILVAADGNSTQSIMYPAAFPEVMAVEAVKSDGSVLFRPADESLISAYAPGANIYSTLPHNRYGYYSGSSMATAYVSAVAAFVSKASADKYSGSSTNSDISQLVKSIFIKSNR
jgi:thermitase